MSSLIDIARSGVMAYRTAMAVTTENVANANTEGYVRREVTMSAKPGAAMSPTSVSTLGQGVQVTDVRRAFDVLTADRLRASESAVASAATQVSASTGLEQAFLPGADGIDAAMGEFFGGLNSLASYPGDLGLRRVVMEMGAGVAASFTEAASSIDALSEDATQAIRLAAKKVSSLLSNLATLNNNMISTANTAGAVNPVQDQRDAALAELARQVEVNVQLDPKGVAEVRLGPGPGGLVLLDRTGAAKVGIGGLSPFSLSVKKDGADTRSTVLTGGNIAGNVLALSSINAAKGELDQLANRFAEAVNAAHAAGVDLDGQGGGQMFSLEGVRITKGATNAGNAAVSVAGRAIAQDVLVRFDAASGLWNASNMDGDILATGAQTLSVAGISVTLEGPVRDGDSFLLQASQGQAKDMRFVIGNPKSIAAAAATIVGPAATNGGNATATIQPIPRVDDGLTSLSETLSSNPAEAVSLIQAGVVGIIPAGTKSVTLASLGLQAMADFAVSDGEISSGGQLSITLSGEPHTFALPAGLAVGTLATQLNNGTIRSDDGRSLSELGLAGSGTNGSLSVAAAANEIDSATLQLATGTLNGIVTPSQDQASGIQVFTRNGRQVAGSPLSAAEAASLITSSNGFSSTAQYDASNLSGLSGTGYRGTVVERQLLPGAQSLTLTPNGGAQSDLVLQADGRSTSLTVPEAASAKRLAAIVDSSLPGIRASAETTVALTSLSDGAIQLELAGSNVAPARISAEVVDGDYSALARAINAATGATGITAELSVGGDRLLLRHGAGEDIRITNFQHGNSGTMSVARADTLGAPLAGATVLGAGVSSIKLNGQVTINGSTAFSTTFLGEANASSTDVFAGNMVTRELSNAGETVRLGFVANDVIDGRATSSDQLTPSAAGLSHQLSVNDLSVSSSGGTSGEEVAMGLLSELRALGPNSSITGDVLSALPPNGAALSVRLDGQTFVLRMEAGTVVVDGPEDGRLTAEFDADMRLQIEVHGGTTDGRGVQLDLNSPMASTFGLTPASVQRLEGRPIDVSELPPGGQVVSAKVGNTVYDLRVEVGPSLSVPAGFPGVATLNDDNQLVLEVPAANGQLSVIESATPAGFGNAGVEARIVDGELELTSVTGNPANVGISVAATASERLTLSNLPPEDLIVVLTSPGALRLSGQFEEPTGTAEAKATELRVTDVGSGAVELFDSETGHSIAGGWLDDRGQVELGGFQITLTGRAESGDSFIVSPNRVPEGDARTLQHMIALAEADPSEGGGFSKMLAELTTGIGAQLNAAKSREDALGAAHETLSRKMAEVGSVDLDAEAARLIELQQAYQASAQAMSIARQLFDTILNIM